MRGAAVSAVMIGLVGAAGGAELPAAAIPPGALATHPGLGTVLRVATPPLPVTAKPIDGRATGWDAGVRLTHLGGATTIQAGEVIYEDWIMDDSGAARTCTLRRADTINPVMAAAGYDKWASNDSAAGEEIIPDADAVGLFDHKPLECQKGVERYGAAAYPGSATPGSADLQELRLAADAESLFVLVRFNAMTAADQPVAAIALDTDHDLTTGVGGWGLESGMLTPGADHVLTLTRQALLVDGAPVPGGRVAANDGGLAGPGNPGGFGGFIEASVPRAALGGGPRWRAWAGSGTWDRAAGHWKAPVALESGPAVMNLAFRRGVEPLRAWMEQAQAFALRRGWDGRVSRVGAAFSQEVDITALAGGANEAWRAGPGYYDRVFTSRVTDGGVRDSPPPSNVEAEGVSAHQLYGLYIPTSYRPDRASPMTLWLHWRGPGDQQAVYYVPNMVRQLGEERGNIVVSPRGRGSSGWYVGDSEIDALDALDDAQAFLATDPDRVDVAGYSMGGWGAYLLAAQFPDRFAAAFATVGPPGIGLWAYPAAPMQPQNGRPLYWTNPLVHNASHVPFVIYHGTDDELVPVTGVIAQSRTFQQGRQPYRFFLFPGYEHFSFALADDWIKAQHYMGDRRRAVNPAHVTYSRMPCLDPVNWSPVYAVTAKQAYWVSAMEVRQAPTGKACTSRSTAFADLNRTGTADVTSRALPRHVDLGLTSVGAACGLPGQTTSCVMTGFEPADGAPLPVENALDVSLTNLVSLTVDGARAGLSACRALTVRAVSDGVSRLTITGLGLMAGGPVSRDGRPAPAFDGALELPAGSHAFTIQPATGCV